MFISLPEFCPSCGSRLEREECPNVAWARRRLSPSFRKSHPADMDVASRPEHWGEGDTSNADNEDVAREVLTDHNLSR